MITKEQYEQARKQHDEAQEVINAYGKQTIEEFRKRWREFEAGGKPFTLDELTFSAGARCEACCAGLAYPKGCSPFHQWDCSAYLLGAGPPHAAYRFTCYEIKSENQASANGHTTRPQ